MDSALKTIALKLLEEATGLNFVFIPTGSYRVGIAKEQARVIISPEELIDDSPTRYYCDRAIAHFSERRVELPGFWIATDLFRLSHWQQLQQSAFASYFRNAGSPQYEENWVHDIRCGINRGFKQFPKDRMERDPAVTATFEKSSDFARILGLRLPNWAEWEVAARGPESYLFPWGNTFDVYRVQLSYLNYGYTWEDPQSMMGLYRDTADISGRYCRIDDFGEYANATSPFGIKGLMYWGLEWNTRGYSRVMRSLLDCGVGRAPASISSSESQNNALGRSNHRAFSGVPLAAFATPEICGQLAAFRFVYMPTSPSTFIL
ncbi:MAG: SUMF1/EgtB/PvdO family nonheme iron enzyme [Cyanobacteria bacterium P01_E01_bin.42]